MRERHPKKEIEDVLREAERADWRVVRSPRGHAWGFMLCPERSRSGCRERIHSTPRSAGRHAAHLRRAIHKCPHR